MLHANYTWKFFCVWCVTCKAVQDKVYFFLLKITCLCELFLIQIGVDVWHHVDPLQAIVFSWDLPLFLGGKGVENYVPLFSRNQTQSHDKYMLWIILATIVAVGLENITSEASIIVLWSHNNFKHKTKMIFHERTRHIEMNCYFTPDKIQDGSFKIQHVYLVDQLANVFTKLLGNEAFSTMIYKLGVLDFHSPTWEGVLRNI